MRNVNDLFTCRDSVKCTSNLYYAVRYKYIEFINKLTTEQLTSHKEIWLYDVKKICFGTIN